MAFKSPFQDDPLKRAKTGFQVIPNAPKAPLPNLPLQQLPTPFSPQDQPSGGMIRAGDRTMAVTPTATYTNFPTARDAVTQSVQRIQQMRQGQVASPVPTNALPGSSLTPPPLTPISQTVAGQYMTKDEQDRAQSQQVFAQQAMIGRDPNTERYDPARMRVVKMTPQEQEQAWSDAKVQETAGLPMAPGQAGAAAPSMFSGQGYLDSNFATNPNLAPPAYRAMTKSADQKIDTTLPYRASNFHDIDDVKNWVKSQNFSPLVSQHVENKVTAWLAKNNVPVYQEIMGNKKADAANMQSKVDYFYEINPDARTIPRDQVEAEIRANPDLDKTLETEVPIMRYNADTMMAEYSPVEQAKQAAIAKEKADKLADINMPETVEREQRRETLEAQAKLKDLQMRAEAEGKVVDYVKGEPRIMTPLQAASEQRKAAREEQTQELQLKTAERQESQAAKVPTIAERKFQRDYQEALDLRSALKKQAYAAFGESQDAATLRKTLGIIDAQNPLPVEPAPTAPVVTPPTTPEQTATNPQTGEKMVLRNGVWVPQQVATPLVK